MAKGRKASHQLQKLIDSQSAELQAFLNERRRRRWAKEFIQFLKDNRVGAYGEEGSGFTNPATYVVFMRAYLYRLMLHQDFRLLMAVNSEWSRRHRKSNKKCSVDPKKSKSKYRLVGIDGVKPVQMKWLVALEKAMSEKVFYDKRIQQQIRSLIRKIIRRFTTSAGDLFVGKKGELAPEVWVVYDALIAHILNRIKLDFSFTLKEAQSYLFYQRPENKEAKNKLSPNNLRIIEKWGKEIGF